MSRVTDGSKPWTSEHYNAIAVQRGDAYALSVAIEDIDKLRTALESSLSPDELDKPWMLPLHHGECPYDEKQAWRYQHSLEDVDSPTCTCTIEHSRQSWCIRAFLLAGAVRMQAGQLDKLRAELAARPAKGIVVAEGRMDRGNAVWFDNGTYLQLPGSKSFGFDGEQVRVTLEKIEMGEES